MIQHDVLKQLNYLTKQPLLCKWTRILINYEEDVSLLNKIKYGWILKLEKLSTKNFKICVFNLNKFPLIKA